MAWRLRRTATEEESHGTRTSNNFSVNFRSEDLILLAAPMPGLEPQNITVSMSDHVLQLKGEERGPRQHELDLKLAEWALARTSGKSH